MRQRRRDRGRGEVAGPVYLLWLGSVSGGVAGLIESVFVMVARGAPASGGAMANTAVFYALVWGVVGLLLGLVSAVLRLGGRRADRALMASLLISLLVLVEVGGYVNIAYLPGIFAGTSILFDIAVVLLCLWLFLVVHKRWRQALVSSRSRSGRRHPLAIVSFLLIVATVAAAGVPDRARNRSGEVRTPRREGPSVLLLVVDALRADHLGCYGYERNTSPNLDRVAREGVLLSSAYAQGSQTKETTASLVTSLYASTHNVRALGAVLPDASPTLMELMNRAGYRTAVFSANALVSPTFGFDRGVDHFYCDMPSPVGRTVLVLISRELGKHVGFMSWLPGFLRSLDVILPVRADVRPFEGIDPNVMNGALLRWINGAPEEPFFAYMHYMDPHTPYAPPPPYDEMFDPEYEGAKVTRPPVFRGLLPFNLGDPLPDAARRNMVAQYDGAIAYFDSSLGRLLDELESRGLLDETLILVTADHGEEFYDHGSWGHGQSLFDELIRVPLLLRYPLRLAAGRRVDATVRHVDILPTILGAVGAEENIDALELEGLNAWPLLTGQKSDWPEPAALAEVYHERQYARALRLGQYKLITARSGSDQSLLLFDLAQDPRETRDLSSQLPDLKEAMLARLGRIETEASGREMESESRVLDEATREKLKALGYVR